MLICCELVVNHAIDILFDQNLNDNGRDGIASGTKLYSKIK